MVQNNPPVLAILQKNILEHISLMAQEQVQLEFVQELQEVQQITQQLQMQAMGATKSCNGSWYDGRIHKIMQSTKTCSTDYKRNLSQEKP
jgi:SH3-like domain-containing protein